jgi:hypothetical protein
MVSLKAIVISDDPQVKDMLRPTTAARPYSAVL